MTVCRKPSSEVRCFMYRDKIGAGYFLWKRRRAYFAGVYLEKLVGSLVWEPTNICMCACSPSLEGWPRIAKWIPLAAASGAHSRPFYISRGTLSCRPLAQATRERCSTISSYDFVGYLFANSSSSLRFLAPRVIMKLLALNFLRAIKIFIVYSLKWLAKKSTIAQVY